MGFLQDNEVRAYPFDESATLTDDNNNYIPEGLLTDLSLTVPRQYAPEVYISAMGVAGGQFAAVVNAADERRTVLAMLRADLATQARQPVVVEPLVDGVFGTFSVGDSNPDIQDGQTWIFSSPSQSRVLPRCVFFVNVGPNLDYSVLNSGVSWSGLVEVLPGTDLTVTVEERELGGEVVEALVIGLVDDTEIYKKYAELFPRPENHTCGDPQPIESINRVRPDCCGRIYIELRGCARPIQLQPTCGVALDCPETTETICPPPVELDPVEDTQGDKCISKSADDKPEAPPKPSSGSTSDESPKPKPPPGYLW
ncbi:MAG: hypothetical protein KatS3mg109_0010 [Pirellulaceae bacterium]|nr:MAG: hypothetical protein KatS3mg109_0010 [Pirellulaceae bacterium]